MEAWRNGRLKEGIEQKIAKIAKEEKRGSKRFARVVAFQDDWNDYLNYRGLTHSSNILVFLSFFL
jgi:hypothetical protein